MIDPVARQDHHRPRLRRAERAQPAADAVRALRDRLEAGLMPHVARVALDQERALRRPFGGGVEQREERRRVLRATARRAAAACRPRRARRASGRRALQHRPLDAIAHAAEQRDQLAVAARHP